MNTDQPIPVPNFVNPAVIVLIVVLKDNNTDHSVFVLCFVRIQSYCWFLKKEQISKHVHGQQL
jgi:hypothetical protein